jgi:hypothetical protein
MNPSVQKKPTLVFFVALACRGFSSTTQAVNPPPDGGYPGGNTAEGNNALLNLTGGTNNTAVGFDTLLGDTTGDNSTAVGANGLFSNTTGCKNTAHGRGALYNNTRAIPTPRRAYKRSMGLGIGSVLTINTNCSFD